MQVQYKNLVGWPEADIPSYATAGAAAMDLRANVGLSQPLVLPPGAVEKIPTGIAIYIGDPGLAAHILPRSGLGMKGLVLANLVGLIDADYQGELVVIAWNRSNVPITITHGDRIAQLEFVPVVRVALVEVHEFERSERGDGGFGSTGSR